MWSNGVGAVCILMTRVVSFTFVNVYEIREKKLDLKIMQKLPCIRHHRFKKCYREIVVNEENKLSM